MRTLYCSKSLNQPMPVMFGIQPPRSDKDWAAYGRMKRRMGLKADLCWGEAQLKHLFRMSNIWSDFPAKGYTIVGVEFKLGDEEQRVDILYIRNDGGLLPCELKIGGTSLDTHGQLIRYVADLSFQDVNLDWVKNYHKEKFLNTFANDATQSMQGEKFYDFLKTNNIKDKSVRILPKAGVIMDENFKPQFLKAVRYLNDYCGFSIRLIQIEAFVADDWHNKMEEYLFRIDFTDVQ